MKVFVPGSTPMERLTNFAKRVVAVPKSDVASEEKKWRKAKRAKPKRRKHAS